MDRYDAANACSVFRSFQGWLSLSHCEPGIAQCVCLRANLLTLLCMHAGKGALQVLPFLKEATAYIMLRPFFDGTCACITCFHFVCMFSSELIMQT